MWKRGNGDFSSTTTRSPLRASAIAATAPPGPPPMMRTSCCGVVVGRINTLSGSPSNAGRSFDFHEQVGAAQVGPDVFDVPEVRQRRRDHADYGGPVALPDEVDAQVAEPAQRLEVAIGRHSRPYGGRGSFDEHRQVLKGLQRLPPHVAEV